MSPEVDIVTQDSWPGRETAITRVYNKLKDAPG